MERIHDDISCLDMTLLMSHVRLSQMTRRVYSLLGLYHFILNVTLTSKGRGLNLDFLTLNITGFFCYSVFNISIFLIYRNQKDHPVEINDIVFSIHAFFLTVFTGIQALIYERGTQKISRINNVILICIALTLGSGVVSLIAKWLSFIHFLYLFSYVKLFVTLIKYIPQAYLNYKRKSTVGWNIWGIILDSTGGIFSFAQMVLLSCSGSKSMSNLNFLSKNSGAVVLNSHTYPACVKEMFISNPVNIISFTEKTMLQITSTKILGEISLGENSVLT
ncbi:unnamed protein product [Gordionus sp. m RMFG-2023]